MPVSRRRVLQAGLAVGATGLVSALTPELVKGAGQLAAPVRSLDLSVGTIIGVFDAGSGPQQQWRHALWRRRFKRRTYRRWSSAGIAFLLGGECLLDPQAGGHAETREAGSKGTRDHP